jgi:PKHD-type hydroxylase
MNNEKEFTNNFLYDYYKQDLLNPEEIKKVHEIAQKFKHINGSPGRIGNSDDNQINREIRRSTVIWIPNNQDTSWLYKKVTDAVRKINDDAYQFELVGAEPFQYTIYNDTERSEYKWHTDTSYVDSYIRKISVSILLSDTNDYKGGAFLISLGPHAEEMEQEKGRMIVFPSWTRHCVTPVLKGTRISLVMWLYGKKFK